MAARAINRLARAFSQTRADLADAEDGPALKRFDASPLARSLQPYKPVALPEPLELAISVSQRLDYASKFNRDPGFLRILIEHGHEQARGFLTRWREDRGGGSDERVDIACRTSGAPIPIGRRPEKGKHG